MEGDPRVGAVRRGAFPGLLCENLAGGQNAVRQHPNHPADGRSSLSGAAGDGGGGKNRGRNSADHCQTGEVRPCGNGKPLYHHHCGCAVASGVFPVCEDAAETVKCGRFYKRSRRHCEEANAPRGNPLVKRL